MINTVKLKKSLHQLVVETYDENMLTQVKDFFQELKAKEKQSKAALALKRMLAEQEGRTV